LAGVPVDASLNEHTLLLWLEQFQNEFHSFYFQLHTYQLEINLCEH